MRQDMDVRTLSSVAVIVLAHPLIRQDRPSRAYPIGCQLEKGASCPSCAAVDYSSPLPMYGDMTIQRGAQFDRAFRPFDESTGLLRRQARTYPIRSIARASPPITRVQVEKCRITLILLYYSKDRAKPARLRGRASAGWVGRQMCPVRCVLSQVSSLP